jgi:hypothetical protein
MSKSLLEVPHQYSKLLYPKRNKTYYGGRYGCKDWSFAQILLFLGSLHDSSLSADEINNKVLAIEKSFKIAFPADIFDSGLIRLSIEEPHRILCCRETQESIEKSIWTLLKDRIDELGLRGIYKVNKDDIVCVNGSNFFFEGLWNNVHNLKSLEKVSICAVLEAENVSDDSWKKLIPTIRKEDSEIWCSFNTRYTDDPTYKRRVIEADPLRSTVIFINSWDVDQYLTKTMREERDEDIRKNPQEAKNVWYGEPVGVGRKVWPMFIDKPHKEGFLDSGHLREFDMQKVVDTGNFFMGMDPAQHYYPACLFMVVFPKNNRKRWPEDFYKWIYAEWPNIDTFNMPFHEARKKILYSGTLLAMANEILMAEGALTHGVKVQKRMIDTRFAKGSGSSNYFSNDSMGLVKEHAKKENGGLIFTMPNEKLIDIQKDNIKKDFGFNTTIPVNIYNESSLYISSKCVNLRTSLCMHRLEDKCEKEAEKYKDFSDCVKILYTALDNFQYDDPLLRVQAQEQYVDTRQYYNNNGDRSQAWMG